MILRRGFHYTKRLSNQNQSNIVFDHALKLRQREWSFRAQESEYYDYLRKEATVRLADRLDDITRSFPLALEINSHRGHFLDCLLTSVTERDNATLGGIRSLIQTDTFHNPIQPLDIDESILKVNKLQCDDESWPFPEQSFDLIINPFSLHWTNDLPTALSNIKKSLKPDGVFLAAMLGGSTLEELKDCFYLAEAERKGGFGTHASPFALPSDIAGLMQAAGFTLPTIDVDTVKVIVSVFIVAMDHSLILLCVHRSLTPTPLL